MRRREGKGKKSVGILIYFWGQIIFNVVVERGNSRRENEAIVAVGLRFWVRPSEMDGENGL